MKTYFTPIISVVLMIFLVIGSSANNTSSWYCIRTPGHRQPPCPAEFSFIKDHSVIWIDDGERETNEKTAYLTFDAGYENGNVKKILDTLNEKEVKGSFFILINLINSNPDLVKRMTDEGHTVCNHTAHHKDMSKISSQDVFNAELDELDRAYKNLTGSSIAPYYRPPEGKFTENNLKMAENHGYTTVLWSFAYADWDNDKQPSEEYALKKIMDNIHDGAVILLHPTSGTNAAILGSLIDNMRKEGYRFGTLDEIMQKRQKKNDRGMSYDIDTVNIADDPGKRQRRR